MLQHTFDLEVNSQSQHGFITVQFHICVRTQFTSTTVVMGVCARIKRARMKTAEKGDTRHETKQKQPTTATTGIISTGRPTQTDDKPGLMMEILIINTNNINNCGKFHSKIHN